MLLGTNGLGQELVSVAQSGGQVPGGTDWRGTRYATAGIWVSNIEKKTKKEWPRSEKGSTQESKANGQTRREITVARTRVRELIASSRRAQAPINQSGWIPVNYYDLPLNFARIRTGLHGWLVPLPVGWRNMFKRAGVLVCSCSHNFNACLPGDKLAGASWNCVVIHLRYPGSENLPLITKSVLGFPPT